MEKTKIKCSLPVHKGLDAITYCQECKIFMCKKCHNKHSGLCLKHHYIKLDNDDINDFFTGFCKEENHLEKLEFFCLTHNKLCCSSCITKLKREGKGQHTDCDICVIEEIKEDKMKNLEENIKYLDDLSKTLMESISNLKKIFEKINVDKEELKIQIQRIFTKLRNSINEREDKILLEVDKQFDDLFFNEEFIRESEKLPNKVKLSLDKGKKINNEWNDENKLNILINECLNIENNLKDIKLINEKLENYNSQNINVRFNPKENDDEDNEEMNNILENINSFGKITNFEFKYVLKKCPLEINESKKFIISGENENVFTKIGEDEQWTGTICKNELGKNEQHSWKIQILNSQNNEIMVGVAPIDFDINSSDYTKCGWYYHIGHSSLYSGPPYNYNNKEIDFYMNNNLITVVLNLNERTLGFINDYSYENIPIYSDIPIDKPLVPVILLYNKEDSIKILEN